MQDLDSEFYSLKGCVKELAKNELLSDVCFEVGDDKVKIYSHKLILSLGSPVFNKMFYGDLKMNETKPISIPDLTPVGFEHMIKYIYGYNISCCNYQDIYETYRACDKYLVHNWKKALYDHLYEVIDYSNCCIVYDQLSKIEDESIDETFDYALVLLKDYSKKIIQLNTKLATGLKTLFCYIDIDTLIDILKMEKLDVDEIDLLIACDNWINFKLENDQLDNNPKNKQDLFKSIRHYINYSEIKIEELSKFEEIKELFTFEEIGKLFLHISFPNNLFIDYSKQTRTSIELSNISAINCNEITNELFEFTLKPNKNLIITSFQTAACRIETRKLSLLIYENNLQIKRMISYEFTRTNDRKAIITYQKDKGLLLKSGITYKMIFHFNSPSSVDSINYLERFNDLNDILELKYGTDGENLFNLIFKQFNHIEKIEFCVL